MITAAGFQKLPGRDAPMFERLMSILKGMFNKGISKMETPEVLAEQAEMELESNFKKVTEALTSGIASEKLLEKNVQKNSQDLVQWEQRAVLAVQQESDDLARKCLAKKQEHAQIALQLEAQLAEQQKTNATLRERHTELKTKLNEFRRKKDEMTSRMKAQDATTKASELAAGSGGSSMDKWEQKIAEKEARSQAAREMAGASKVDDEFKAWDKQVGLDDELAALKANMAAAPKLITAAPKDQVDENVPMVVEEIKPPDDKKK
jgi:phage shock protein A